MKSSSLQSKNFDMSSVVCDDADVDPQSAIQTSPPSAVSPLINFRPYQREAFLDTTTGIEVWLWGRQTGKSFTLAAWSVNRLIQFPGRTVTILSNSKANGMELNRQCAEICRLLGQAFEQVDLSTDDRFENLNCETRVRINGRVGRILVLPANPRTARGFSGDAVFDEFAFQEDGAAIWDAASPILAANKDFLCRIASTPNGKHNQFYRMATDPNIPRRIVTRTMAYEQGCSVFHAVTRAPITPAEARELAPNKRSYDQNFECVFEDENMALLTHQLINAAERSDVGMICNQDWTSHALHFLSVPDSENSISSDVDLPKSAREWIAGAADETQMNRRILMNVCNGSADRFYDLLHSNTTFSLDDSFDRRNEIPKHQRDSGRRLFVGVDVGRNRDRTVITVLERAGDTYQLRAILRLSEMRLPEQQARLEQVLRLPDVRAAKIDMTGLGLGLYEYTQAKYKEQIMGVNFASSVPVTDRLRKEGRSGETVRVTEALATQLLQAFEDRAIQIPIDNELRDDLRKPERFVSPSGRVSIAATRNEADHADHFWSLALALSAAQTPVRQPFEYYSWKPAYRDRFVSI
jgi:phage FluMu gp28-like protein